MSKKIISNKIMGNEGSRYPELEIETTSLEVTDNWSLHNAKDFDDVYTYSVFISELISLKTTPSLLEKFAKNLMICRHPCIIKYVSSWKLNNKFHLVTEQVQPLMLVLPNQSALQICVGLHSILSAVVFLHEKAKSSHNNICCASVYVTPEGIWKLGGLECLMKFSEVTATFLKENRKLRYEKAVAPEEDNISNAKVNAAAIDKYAFGIMVEELLKKKSSSEISFLTEFLDYCKKHLQNLNPNERPNFSEVLQHPFFNHDFIKIYKFLFYLPLKSSTEKEHFFNELTEQLHLLPEDVVACQLTSLLLSRVVLLDCTAQKHLLPVLLQPKIDEKQNVNGLFSENVFKTYVVPKLLNIFCVRDAQIRIILLNNFHLFCHMFGQEELRNQILPELLLGIKDVNDQLVSVTLKALSHLVLILGASTVIGGKRGKLFNDGRPKFSSAPNIKNKVVSKKKNIHSPLKSSSEILFTNNNLPERPSPDGGEDKLSSSSTEETETNETEHWSDWGLPAEKNLNETIPESPIEVVNNKKATPLKPLGKVMKEEDSKITFLDIKNSANDSTSDEIMDFFRDMEPVINKTQILNIKPSKSKFDVENDEPNGNFDGWEEDWELDEEKT